MIKTSATRLQPGGRQKGQRTPSESPLEPFEQHLRPRAAHLESGLTRADDANAQHQTEAEPPLLIYRPQPLRKGRARVFRSRGQGGGLARPDLLSQLGSRAPPAGHGARRRCAAKRGCRRLVPLAAVLTCSQPSASRGWALVLRVAPSHSWSLREGGTENKGSPDGYGLVENQYL